MILSGAGETELYISSEVPPRCPVFGQSLHGVPAVAQILELHLCSSLPLLFWAVLFSSSLDLSSGLHFRAQCVNVEVAVLGSPSPVVDTVSVDVKRH